MVINTGSFRPLGFKDTRLHNDILGTGKIVAFKVTQTMATFMFEKTHFAIQH